MNKYVINIGLLLVGLIVGYLIFGNKGSDQESSKDEHNHEHAEEKEQIWTCSMHPQIRQNEPGDCPICGMDLIPLDENSSQDPMIFTMTDEAVKISNIQTTPIGSKEGSSSMIRFSGKVEADETQAASLVSHLSGRIEKLYVSFKGENVGKGQKVATIYSPDLIGAQQELLEANKTKNEQPGLYQASLNKLKNWKLTDAQIEQVLSSGEVKEYFDIYSDHSGVVLDRKVAVGDYIKTGQVLFDIQNLNQIWAVFDAYESDLGMIHLGDELSFTTPSLPGEKFMAKLSFIDPTVDPKTRTVAIRANLKNSGSKLKPDMFLEGELAIPASSSDEMLVPKSAVLWTGKRSVVYVKLPDMTVPSYEYHEIELGEASGDYYKVLSGLNAGDEVVTNGAFVIDASAQLNNQASMMNKHLVENSVQNQSSDIYEEKDFSNETPITFKDQLSAVVNSYIELKDALVNDDFEIATNSAGKLLSSLEAVDMSLLKGDAHLYWMSELTIIKDRATYIKDASIIGEQRKAFHELSEAMIKSAEAFGVESTYYVLYCPMANESKGANWLSNSDKILNPYFGSAMLNCGEVTKKLEEK